MPFLAISWGNLLVVFYTKLLDEPANPAIKKTLAHGLQVGKVFQPDMPDKVVVWLRDFHNRFHGGLNTTCPEALDEFKRLSVLWDNLIKANNLSSRGVDNWADIRLKFVKPKCTFEGMITPFPSWIRGSLIDNTVRMTIASAAAFATFVEDHMSV